MSDQTRRILAIILALAMVGSLAAGVISSFAGAAASSAPQESRPSSVHHEPVETEAVGPTRSADGWAAVGEVDAPLVLIAA
ncbi:hypothetical protein O9K63_11740 [Janibacter cremeus]|uniref:hypothetical protein n=1 Tax=Janibacter cremeus TaxID=1285192 RepID=UPI0023F98E1A|nr:hypothetical protein [Janibacter cremeus]WEV77261.1 hypothetical protein O9K63_11740 [Janibacter cremeus]